MARARSLLVALALGGAALIGCGGDDVVVRPAPGAGPPGPGAAPPAGGTTARDPLADAGAQGAERLTITVDDERGRQGFRYRAPRSVRSGLVEISLRNEGAAPRKAQLWRITGDHSVEEALAIRSPLPDWLRRAGGVSLTAPGATSRSLQALPAGRYYIAATRDEPGAVAALEATSKSAAPARSSAPPRAPARVEAVDFSFKVSGLRPGVNSVDFDNTGNEPHHAFFAPMRRGTDLDDVRSFFATRTSTGPPPVDPEGTRETVVLEGGERQVTQLDLAAGRYALICFVRGRRGGPRHLELGMINEVTVR